VDGNLFVRNLDFDCYSSLIAEEHFQTHFIGNKAERMTADFAKLIQPFIGSSAMREKIDEQDEKRCLDIFKRCLSLKAEMALTGDSFAIRVPSTTEHNDIWSQVECVDIYGAPVPHQLLGDASAIKLCLVPALYCIPRDAKRDISSQQQHEVVVVSNNFRTLEESPSIDHEWHLTTRSLVLYIPN